MSRRNQAPELAKGTLRLYYDERCKLCLRTRDWLLAQQLRDVNLIGVRETQTQDLPGRLLLLRTLHVRTATGEWLLGFDALLSIVQRSQRTTLARLLALPLIRPAARLLFDYWELKRYQSMYSCKDCSTD